jgi:leader peptidase (prepilin peptidase)/N-methyltransferase
MFPANFSSLGFVFIFGLLIGSFLNVIIYRLPHKQKILNLHSRSRCPHCKHTLSFLDLVPVFSFLWLRGRCRYCQKKISVQYPLVEILTAVTFSVLFYSTQSPVVYLLFVISAITIVIFFVDLNTHYIYDVTLWILGVAALVWVFFNGSFFAHLSTGILTGTFFYLLAFVGQRIYGKQALGEGDIPLAALIAFLAGPELALISFYCAFILGGLVAGFLLLAKKAKRGTELAFAPFLISGWALALLTHVIKI